jgi:hypothetical protein
VPTLQEEGSHLWCESDRSVRPTEDGEKVRLASGFRLLEAEEDDGVGGEVGGEGGVKDGGWLGGTEVH